MINFIPLAFAAIVPVGVGLVILLLSARKGLGKALAYLTSEALAFAIWGIVFLNLTFNFEGVQVHETSRGSLALRTFLGILLLVVAIRILLTNQDPDSLPIQWKSQIERISATALFFINLFLSLLRFRFVILIMIGADMIQAARFSLTGTVIGFLILLLVLLWPQLLPLGIFLSRRNQSDKALQFLDEWLTRNSRYVSAGGLGIIGIVLILGGLIELAS